MTKVLRLSSNIMGGYDYKEHGARRGKSEAGQKQMTCASYYEDEGPHGLRCNWHCSSFWTLSLAELAYS